MSTCCLRAFSTLLLEINVPRNTTGGILADMGIGMAASVLLM